MTACLTVSAQDYESRYFFWEVVELLRKAAFTIVIVVFAGTPTQMILAVLLGVASIAAYGHFQPFREQSDDNLMALSNLQLFFALLYGLLDVADLSEASNSVMQLYCCANEGGD